MLENIQVPESANHTPEIKQQTRHVKKLIAIIGIPLLIIIIILSVYFYNLRPRFSASQTLPAEPANKTVETGVNSLLPSSNESLLPSQKLNTEEYKKYFDSLNLTLIKYDTLFQDIKLSGQCYSSATENNKNRDAWILSINSILSQKIPELSPSKDASKEELDNFNQIKTLTQKYNQEIKNFIESDKQVYDKKINLNKVLFKICDGAIDQIENNCKDLPNAVTDFKKAYNQDLNKDLNSNLDLVLNYCSQVPEVLKSDNDTKFTELNNQFSSVYSKIVSTYPNLQDKITIIKEVQDQIKKTLS